MRKKEGVKPQSGFILPLVLLCLAAVPCSAQIPELFRSKAFTSATFAEAVNHYVALGEAKAVQELQALGEDKDKEPPYARLGWMCRVLFEPKSKTPLRPPGFGGLSLPSNTMPLEKWPLYPVARSGNSYFVLSEGYTIMGQPESPTVYLDYCRKNGVFRTKPVPVPTRKQAQADALRLQQSAPWHAIKWNDSGPGFMYRIE